MQGIQVCFCTNQQSTINNPKSEVEVKIHILAGLLLLGSAGNALAQDVGGNVVKYHATIDDVKYVYGVAEPVTRLKPGDILDTHTLDCFAGPALKKPGDTLSMVKMDNPLSGPFYIEGAEPGRHAGGEVSRSDGRWRSEEWGRTRPAFGALTAAAVTRRC